MKLLVRELQKACLQHILLPFVYCIFSYQKVDDSFVILADSKSDGVPFSLKAMHKELQTRNYKILVWCHNYDKLSFFEKLSKSILFMKNYARAKYVFICDYYLPVSSCNKRKETKVIQLWHASGALKKFGYDADDDLRKFRFINPVKNFDLVSVSSDYVKNIYQKAFKLAEKQVKAFGSSRSDVFFDDEYVRKCKSKFFKQYPNAVGKKIILWAPSFRGNGSNARINIFNEIIEFEEVIGKDYYLVIKLHPHLRERYRMDNCLMETEELYPVVDILITDYSSVIFDYLIFKNTIILYVPDFNEYSLGRGIYLNFVKEKLFPVVFDIQEMVQVLGHNHFVDTNKLKIFQKAYINDNDGKSTKRILDYLKEVD